MGISGPEWQCKSSGFAPDNDENVRIPRRFLDAANPAFTLWDAPALKFMFQQG
jgi:hypothetical protein